MSLVTTEFVTLDFRACICAPAELNVRTLRPTGPAWARAADAPVASSFLIRSQGHHRRRYELLSGGRSTIANATPSNILAQLDRAINAAAVAHLVEQGYVLLHAGVVALGDRGVLLPAASGAGKSTLVAGLVAAGCQYLSDEVAVVDLTGRLLPFPKHISLRGGGWRALRSAYPEHQQLIPVTTENQRSRSVSPSAWPEAPVRVAAVIVPHHIAGGKTTLVPLPRASALEAILGQATSARQHGYAGLRTLIAVVQGAVCYALTSGGLRASVELVLGALADGRP